MNTDEKIAALYTMYTWAVNKNIKKITMDGMSLELTEREITYGYEPLPDETVQVEDGDGEIDESGGTKYDPDYLIKNAKNLF